MRLPSVRSSASGYNARLRAGKGALASGQERAWACGRNGMLKRHTWGTPRAAPPLLQLAPMESLLVLAAAVRRAAVGLVVASEDDADILVPRRIRPS